MALARQQAAGSVQANPTCAGQIHLAPSVQVGEVDFGAAGAVERFHIGFELNQVAGHKARCQAAVAQQLHQQPGRVTAGARGFGQRFFGRLHAGLHADGVADGLVDHGVEVHQKNHTTALGSVNAV